MKLAPAILGLMFVAWLVGESEQFGKNMGPYDFIIERIYLCDDQGTGQGNFNVSLYLGPPDAARKRKHLHRGGFSWPFTKEQVDTMEIEGDFYQKKNNDFLKMYQHRDDLCKTMMDIATTSFQSLREATGITGERCYIDNRDYTFNDWDIPFTLPTPMLEYGSYKAIVRMLVEKKVFGCVIVLGEAKPKQ